MTNRATNGIGAVTSRLLAVIAPPHGHAVHGLPALTLMLAVELTQQRIQLAHGLQGAHALLGRALREEPLNLVAGRLVRLMALIQGMTESEFRSLGGWHRPS